jgi:hypothetical protein
VHAAPSPRPADPQSWPPAQAARSFSLCKLKKVLRAAEGVSIYGTQSPPGGCGSDFRASGQRASDFFVLPDYPNPAKTLAGVAPGGEDGGCVGEAYLKNLPERCPVLATDGNLLGRHRLSPSIRMR